ncbi:hypothetical protein Hanom_Chr12g01163051 [Helianthus anomalus]
MRTGGKGTKIVASSSLSHTHIQHIHIYILGSTSISLDPSSLPILRDADMEAHPPSTIPSSLITNNPKAHINNKEILRLTSLNINTCHSLSLKQYQK